MFTDEYFSDQVSAQAGGEGGQPNADSCRQGQGRGSKITKNVRTSFMDGPSCEIFQIIFFHRIPWVTVSVVGDLMICVYFVEVGIA